MGRLTEAIFWYNMEKLPSRAWIRQQFSQFDPTDEDHRARKEYWNRLQKQFHGRRKVMKDLFDS